VDERIPAALKVLPAVGRVLAQGYEIVFQLWEQPFPGVRVRAYHGARLAGHALFAIRPGDVLHPDNASVSAGDRRRGLADALYLCAQEVCSRRWGGDFPIVPAFGQSADARAFWDRAVKPWRSAPRA
jgi:hypothetical protein